MSHYRPIRFLRKLQPQTRKSLYRLIFFASLEAFFERVDKFFSL